MERFNLDQAYEKIGSFGRMQYLLTFVCSALRNSGSYIFYTFAYLILEQRFLCSHEGADFATCTRQQVC